MPNLYLTCFIISEITKHHIAWNKKVGRYSELEYFTCWTGYIGKYVNFKSNFFLNFSFNLKNFEQSKIIQIYFGKKLC